VYVSAFPRYRIHVVVTRRFQESGAAGWLLRAVASMREILLLAVDAHSHASARITTSRLQIGLSSLISGGPSKTMRTKDAGGLPPHRAGCLHGRATTRQTKWADPGRKKPDMVGEAGWTRQIWTFLRERIPR
jgi:hypothetical protein